ncbi:MULTISPECIES: sigma-70 family RNA polymerase sigma factor [unclassified Janthinobacterium]|uniref:sigma-70 family RNA polymerase sigma factor n=1 Tax=unclassified Janthinobacterium TaxID=2610881 RepID=UPI0027128558|nr:MULTISPECIES: sigma-70 family RNA polymerase sigma factor [unclassified Janthinobacterium]MDO8064611.1 sigma-70 family RNA polymerase sigma factor [Janthinobacterium sp. SUN206]MDO8070948.1 sigma-70 family RNA polymerase sigma factor [Janthinobacterium sp. SUN176]MED5612437.1 sigma-70 family RNA polymerase sigma factor [Janthinobacterium sp. P210005]
MSAAQPGVHQEVGSLYHDHHRWLQGWLRHKLGNAFDAADVAHDTFMRLLNRDEAIAAREPRAFLTTVAKGVLGNLYRRRDLEAAYLETLASLPAQCAPDPEAQAILLEALFDIDRRLDGLAPAVRRAFLLSQLDGMPQAAIALELNISLATVQRHLVKAMHQCFFSPSAP